MVSHYKLVAVMATKTRNKKYPNATNATNNPKEGNQMLDDNDKNDRNQGSEGDVVNVLSAMRAQMDAQFAVLEAKLLGKTTGKATGKNKKSDGRAPRGTPTAMTPLVRVAAAPPPPPPEPRLPWSKKLDMKDRIELALLRESASYAGIAKVIQESVAKVKENVDRLFSEGCVGRVTGYDDQTIWAWCVMPHDDNAERRKRVRKLMSERPIAYGDIVRALGKHADPVKVQNDVVEIRRHENVWDYSGGNRHANVYFIPPDGKEPPPNMDGRLKAPRKKK